MNKEEIESFDKLDINLNDVDDLDMGVEIISYKARKTMQEFADIILKQQSQLTKSNNKIEKIKEYCKEKDAELTMIGIPFMETEFTHILSIIDGGE